MLDKINQEIAKGNALSIIKLVDLLMEAGEKLHASDIHISPRQNKIFVRFRVDGIMRDGCDLPKAACAEIISRIKILAGLRTDEHQAAQDGRFRFSGNVQIDVRVSIIPTYYGENAVMRLLSNSSEQTDLKLLGFRQSELKKILQAAQKPGGMILATGPTGSGKTTTLYALLGMLNTSAVSTVTIEDPVEYAIAGTQQIQVNSRTSLTFSNGLRAILRQDPDIIMVGEIRDNETAALAVNSALTGHLLLSTLHTIDASTALPRLFDLKIEPYLIASTVSLIIAQRLARKICLHCKFQKRLSAVEAQSLSGAFPSVSLRKQVFFYAGRGCLHCAGSGYNGRINLNEVLVLDSVLREAVLKKASASEIKNLAVLRGMKPMLSDGLDKAANGITTVEEILRVCYE